MSRKKNKQVIGTCKLCLQEKKLCRSHVLPNFYFKPLLKTGNKIFAVTNVEGNKIKTTQSGVWEHMLCESCENLFSEQERYVAELFNKKSAIIDREFGIEVIVDYKVFKLHQLSILWRMSVSNNTFFSQVELGEHQEVLRLMLINQDPGNWDDFPCVLIQNMDHRSMTKHFIIAPETLKSGRTWNIRLLLAGMFWIYMIGDKKEQVDFEKVILSPKGRLPILFINGPVSNFLDRMITEMAPFVVGKIKK